MLGVSTCDLLILFDYSLHGFDDYDLLVDYHYSLLKKKKNTRVYLQSINLLDNVSGVTKHYSSLRQFT